MNKESKNNVDEISLEDLVLNTLKIFTNLITGLINRLLVLLVIIRRFIIEKIVFLIIGSVIGGLSGFFFSKLTPPIYETSLTLKSDFLNGFDFLYEIEKLDDYIKDRNFTLIAELFNSDVSNVAVLKGISAKSYYNHHNIFERYGEIEKLDSLSVASEMNSRLFVVTLKMNSNAVVLENIETWLINFLEKNELLNKNYDIKKNILLRTEEKLLTDLASLDTLRKAVNNKLLFEQKDNFTSKLEISISEEQDIMKDPLAIYEKDYKIFQELQEVRRSITLIERISIVNGIKLIKENKLNFQINNVFWGAIYGFLSICILFVLIRFNNFLNEFESKN